MGTRKLRIAVLTGGGDCPGLNAVIRAVVKAAENERESEVFGIEYGFKGLVEDGLIQRLDSRAVKGILPRGGTVLGTTNKANPFSYVISPAEEARDLSDIAVKKASELGLDALIVVGGDGTLEIAHRLAKKGIPIIGIPKTIDGDVTGTDATIGFDTARAICTEAIDRLHTTAEAHDRVMILEVMGRDSGFLALHSGIAGGADVILIPELPYSVDPIVAEVERRRKRGRSFSIVVVAEGATPQGGGQTIEKVKIVGRGEVKLGGVGNLVASQIASAIPLEVRVTSLGHLQRGGTPTPEDRLLAQRFGTEAVRLATLGKRDRMVSIRHDALTDVPLEEAAGRRKLAPDAELIRVARALGSSFGVAAG